MPHRLPGSLTARLIGLLTVALLPLGLIAVYQTFSVTSKVESLARRDMLSRTADAANAQGDLILQAQGAARAMGAVALAVGPETDACDEMLGRFVDNDPRFAFAGFVFADGRMECSSNGRSVDFSTSPTWGPAIESPHPRVTVNRRGAASGLSVMISSVPIYDGDDELAGIFSISIPHSLSDLLFDRQIEGLEVAIVDSTGKVLSASTGIDQSSAFDALHVVPAEMDIPDRGRTLNIVGPEGDTAISVVPLVPGEAFVVGKWSGEAEAAASVSLLGTATPLFPVAMWAAGLFVAVFALNSLVLKHLKALRQHMRAFSVSNLEASYVRLNNAPSEIAEIGDSYNALLDRIMDDTVELAESVREKEMLLKEVHHRVKNNLQLIASILNMQLRQIEAPEARQVLRQVQDRVMSLATIHKLLYSDAQVDTVRADILLSEIIQSAVNVGSSSQSALETRISLDPVELDPDQAVPLSLLVTEAVTNALKNIGEDADGERFLSVELTEPAQETVELRVVNSCNPGEEKQKDSNSGLGTRLIQAFVSQLEGTSDVGVSDDRYTLWVRFEKFPEERAEEEAA
jgi:two-component sensor histidine kinase